MHPSRGLLRKSLDFLEQLGIFLVDEVGKVAAVVEDHVERLTVLKPVDCLLNTPNLRLRVSIFGVVNCIIISRHAPHVLLVGLSLPGVDRDATCGHGGRRMVLEIDNVHSISIFSGVNDALRKRTLRIYGHSDSLYAGLIYGVSHFIS